jgi:hypothetical protein
LPGNGLELEKLSFAEQSSNFRKKFHDLGSEAWIFKLAGAKPPDGRMVLMKSLWFQDKEPWTLVWQIQAGGLEALSEKSLSLPVQWMGWWMCKWQ